MNYLRFVKLVKEYIEISLKEVADSNNDFNIGQRYAYVEVLELIQSQLNESELAEVSLDYIIEEVYPLE